MLFNIISIINLLLIIYFLAMGDKLSALVQLGVHILLKIDQLRDDLLCEEQEDQPTEQTKP